MESNTRGLVEALDTLFLELMELPVPQPAGRKKRRTLKVDVTRPEVADYLQGVGQSLLGKFKLKPRVPPPEPS